MKRYIKSDSDYISFKPPIRKSDIDIDYVAKQISKNLSEKPDVEDVIEQFRMMSDDYDDFCGRGLRTREQEQAFVEELLDALSNYGITEVTNIYNSGGGTTMKYYKQGDECTFEPGQKEYELLEALADKLMELSPNGFKYWVDDVYLDYGSRWMWTTVISEDTISPYFQSTYQALSPAEWLALMNGEDITEIAEHVLGDKYCPDKIKSSKSIRKGTYITSSRTVVVDPVTIPNIRKAMRSLNRDRSETLLIPGWGQIKRTGKRYAVGPLPENDDSDILTDYSAWSYDIPESMVLDWFQSEPPFKTNSIKSSTNTCNIASKPVFGDDDFEEDESDPRYEVCGYYDSRFYGLGDSAEFDDLSDAEDYVWSLVNQGYFTTLEDRETGEVRDFSPDKLDESLEANGEVYDITDAEVDW